MDIAERHDHQIELGHPLRIVIGEVVRVLVGRLVEIERRVQSD
jgi:hypothetical protein